MIYFTVAVYLTALGIISTVAKIKTKNSPVDYFLAGRSFGSIVLFFTITATNFSAFFFLGFAGAAWKYGFGQYGIMGIGTALVPVSFYFVGKKAWELGKSRNYITLPELAGGELKSPLLKKLLLGVMVISTLPYLYTQALGAGIIMSSAFGFDCVKEGACLAVFFIGTTVILGGMRGTAWTDVFQGLFMTTAMAAALFFVARSLGGFSSAGQNAYTASPGHFSRPGPENYFTERRWLSLIILWSFVNPLFPQLFTRFYAAKNMRTFKTSLCLYPLLVSFLFLAPVLIGVWAKGTTFSFDSPDYVLPAMVHFLAPEWVYAFVMTGALAALMSTADSQLLSVSTMLAKDFVRFRNEILAGKILTFFICTSVSAMVLMGLSSDTAIFNFLIGTTFSALAAAFPAVICALYFNRAGKHAVICSLLAGEATVVLIFLKIIPTKGFADGVVAMSVSLSALFISIVLISLLKFLKKPLKL
ncbi:sodium:solute symporter family protein [candidate division WOR-3 bacterium]|nr:sodium:solute symporter family protein [candidate division WOR-3 bacterium]